MTDTGSLIAAARRAHPAFRFALAVAGMGTLVVIFSRFGVSLATISFGILVLLSLMTAFVIFARVSLLPRRQLTRPALLLLWTVLLLTLATFVLLFTSAFFNTPLPLRDAFLPQRHLSERPNITPTRVRIALVVGNWEYDSPGARLQAPERDLKLVANSLRQAGFHVVELRNATRRRFLEDWKSVEVVGRYGGVALLYYSGNGTRHNGRDYIFPVSETIRPAGANAPEDRLSALDAKRLSDSLPAEQFSTSTPNKSVHFVGVKLSPPEEATNDGADGPPPPHDAIDVTSLLSQIEPLDTTQATGTNAYLTLYSVSPGQPARDTGPDGAHSPFAVAFAQTIATDAGDIRQVLQTVSERTMTATNGRQVPWVAGTYFGKFSFKDRARDEDFAILRIAVFDISRGSLRR